MKIGNVVFFTKSEYMAGLRDSGRIELLRKQTDLNNPAAAAALFRELKNQPFYFETEVGKEFLRELLRKTRPSDRGVGVGIRRQGYRTTEEEEERIRAYEESRKVRLADSIRIIGNDAEDSDRYHDFVYDENEEIPGRRPVRNQKTRSLNYADNYAQEYQTKVSKRQKNSGSAFVERQVWNSEEKRAGGAAYTDKNNSSDTKRSKEKTPAERKRKKEQKRSLLLLVGILSVLMLGYCVTDEVSYRIKSFASEKKMERLQNSVLQPVQKAKADEPVMERVAMAGTDSMVLSDSNSVGQPEAGKSDEILPEYAELYRKNNDLIGWIRIPETKVNYPVMQTKEDMEYYLYRDFDGDDDVNGLPFLDARCDIDKPTTNMLIYGHSMNSGAMFATLAEYKNYEFFKEHPTIYFDTIQERGEYEIVAVFQSRVAYVDEVAFRYYNFIQADTEEEFESFVSAVEQLAYYDTGNKAVYGDRLLTLSTCDREITDGRLVVLARKCD